MKLSVLLFGIARDIVGDRQISVDLPKNENVAGLLNYLKKEYPSFNDLQSLLVAVNDTYAKSEHVLQEDDEIALIPPVSGG